MKKQSVARTAHPDGRVVHYEFGMNKPQPKCMGEFMKQQVFNLLTQIRNGKQQ